MTDGQTPRVAIRRDLAVACSDDFGARGGEPPPPKLPSAEVVKPSTPGARLGQGGSCRVWQVRLVVGVVGRGCSETKGRHSLWLLVISCARVFLPLPPPLSAPSLGIRPGLAGRDLRSTCAGQCSEDAFGAGSEQLPAEVLKPKFPGAASAGLVWIRWPRRMWLNLNWEPHKRLQQIIPSVAGSVWLSR